MTGPKKILMVEDELIIRVLCQRLLGEGYDLTVVESVREACRLLGESRWDLLITDLRLPDGDGIEVIQTLRSHDQACKVIIVTGSPTPEERMAEIKDAGVDRYISKPFEVDILTDAVRSVLEN